MAEACFSPFWGRPDLWSLDRTVAALREAGFDLRGQVDLSDSYAQLIAASAPDWGALMSGLSGVYDPARSAKSIADMVEMWTRREQALKDRKLKLMRFTAMRGS